MKKLALSLLSVCLLACITESAMAQKKIKEGLLTYSMAFPELPEEAQAMAGMLPNKMEVHFNESMSRIETKGGMVNNISIINIKEKKVTNLMNMMGNKIAQEGDFNDNKDEEFETKITYIDETKEILGYECKKAIITAGEVEMEVFYTDKLKINTRTSATSSFDNLKGFPMEYTTMANGVKAVIKITGVEEKKIESSKFDIPEGYTKMTDEELKQKFGGGF